MTTLERIESVKAECRELAMTATASSIGEPLYKAYLEIEKARFHAAAVEIGQEKV